MRLDRPTHFLESDGFKLWMSEFTEEIAGQIAAGITQISSGDSHNYAICPLPADAAYDQFPSTGERVQTCGSSDQFTVELRRLDADGLYRLYTVGHAEAGNETDETEPISNGDSVYLVRPGEVLTATEAINLFQHYYDHHAIPLGWHLREQAEFTTPA